MTDTLLALVDRQAQQLNELEQLLRDERRALTQLDIEQLAYLSRSKDALLQCVNDLDGEIGRHPDCHRLNSDLEEKKQAIAAILGRCRDHNQANGQIIEHALLRNRQLIDILSKLRSQNSFTYNNKGRVHGGGLLKKGISV